MKAVTNFSGLVLSMSLYLMGIVFIWPILLQEVKLLISLIDFLSSQIPLSYGIIV